ncbi:MAG: hypothetical protein ABSF23_01845 [Terracidiphilus sp.]|jgi:uncharacterized membrane protein YgcG
MSVSRRVFLADASALGMIAALLPQLAAGQTQASEAAGTEDLPHDSYDFWNGFYDSVNPYSKNYGTKAATRGPADQLPDPKAQTQYLHYSAEKKHLRYASDIEKEELLDHDGDVTVSIAIAQYRQGDGESNLKASQLRIDTTQIHPLINVAAPLAWAAIASIAPSTAKSISLDDMGFRSVQATQGTSKILLTRGTGKLSVNISKAAQQSMFIKALNLMIQAGKAVAPLVSLPAISVPALSTFTEALSYWEDRTRFVMAGNLTTAVATKQALDDEDREPQYIGLIPGDYLMVPARHVDELAKAIPNLDLVQGYLVAKDADPNLPLARRAEAAVPGVTYASMHVGVSPAPASCSRSTKSSGGLSGLLGGSSSSSSSSGSSKSSSSSGSKKK